MSEGSGVSFSQLPLHEKVGFCSSVLFIAASALGSMAFLLRLKSGGIPLSDPNGQFYQQGARYAQPPSSGSRAREYFTS